MSFLIPHCTGLLIFPPCSTTVDPTVPSVLLAVLPKNCNPEPTTPNPDLTLPKTYYFLSSKSLGGYGHAS